MWEIIAALAPALFQMLFGNKSGNTAEQKGTSTGTTETTTTSPAKVAFDPLYYALSPTLMKAIGGNYMNMAGAGMPGGRAAGDVGIGNMSDIINMISQSWPDIMKAFTAPTAPATPAEDVLPDGSPCGGVNETKKCAAGSTCFNGKCVRAKNVA